MLGLILPNLGTLLSYCDCDRGQVDNLLTKASYDSRNLTNYRNWWYKNEEKKIDRESKIYIYRVDETSNGNEYALFLWISLF